MPQGDTPTGAMTGALPETIGRYEVLQLLGEGAMGRVLLGRDPVLDRQVAIKLLRDDLQIPEEQRADLFERMGHEARASARIGHPNIVVLHDMGEDRELGLYLVHEYAPGSTLKQHIEEGRLNPSSAASLATELGGALNAAHQKGVLHRDVKPDNIILTEYGAKIADFGIARIPESTITRAGGVLGTPAYSSPESVTDGAFSAASDQFSLATTLYEAISGNRAFPGTDTVQVANRITTETPPGIARSLGLDSQVDAVLLRGMAKQASQRYPTAAAFGTALSEALGRSPRPSMATVPDALHQQRQQTRESSQRLAWGLTGALAGASVLAVASYLFGGGDAEPRSTPPSSALRVDAPPMSALQAPAIRASASTRDGETPPEAIPPASGTPRKASRPGTDSGSAAVPQPERPVGTSEPAP